MKIRKMNRLSAIVFLFLVNFGFGQSEFSAEGFNVLRLENEIKLSVPGELRDSVWDYLNGRYLSENLYLRSIDSSFNCETAIDVFVDQYFDNKKFQLLASQNGIRHRTRSVLTDSESRKDGRELMQFKISDSGYDELTRGEYKYEIRHYENWDEVMDAHPFLGLVKRSQRNDIISRLKEFSIQAENLLPTIKIEQERKRIYVFKGITPYATLTLDNTTAAYGEQTAKFTELELELNEIGYTESDSLSRKEMEEINEIIKSDVLTRFPSITQDQTPKYNKAATALGIEADNPAFSSIYLIIGGSIVALIVFLMMLKDVAKLKNVP